MAVIVPDVSLPLVLTLVLLVLADSASEVPEVVVFVVHPLSSQCVIVKVVYDFVSTVLEPLSSVVFPVAVVVVGAGTV